MAPKSDKENLQFISGGGEMGALTRAKNWNEHTIGPVNKWPQSLRTTLSIILNSKFPMFLWWGPDLICFYNDAYRPSLGQNGKHPSILGMKAEEAWTEIWDIIKPLIDKVLAGDGATWSEDQLIPIFRNGKIEDVYWTFSYSPVINEEGKVAGVLVTCSETTEKVNAFKKATESEERFRTMAESSEILIALSDGTSNATYFNKAWVVLTGRPMEDLLEFGWLDLIHIEDRDKYLNTYLTAFENKTSFTGEFRVLNKEGNYQSVFVKVSPRFDKDGSFEGYISSGIDITENKQTQKKIKENEEKLNIIINTSGVGIWELNLKTKEVNYSDRYLEIIGHEKGANLTHEQLLKHLHPDDFHIREKAFKEAFISGTLHYESRLIWNDKSIHWMEGRGQLFYDENNNPHKLIGIIRDITVEKNHEQELIESEQTFRLLADSMPQFVWTGDANGNLNYFNKSVYDYSGLTPEQIDKEGWLQIVHPDDREENIKAWINSISTGQNFLFEHRFRRYDGAYHWQLSRAVPQRDIYGNIQMWVGTSTDIQDQKTFTTELEKQVKERTIELKKSEERYHLMVEEVQDYAILYLNKEGIVENWNKGAEKIKGYKAEEIIGKSFSVFYTEKDKTENLPFELLKKAIIDGKAVQEGLRVRKDKSTFWASVVITAVHDEENNVIGFSKVTHDLTEKKEADDKIKLNAIQLQQKNSTLEKMNNELQSFAYVSSHDLQEPLRKIQTFANRIIEKESNALSDTGKDYFRRMQVSAARMQQLIEDLLTYSRTNITDKHYEQTDLKKIIEEVIDDLKEEINLKNAIITIDEMKDVKIIPFQFRQLMHNLIGNSLKFSRPDYPAQIHIKNKILKGHELNNKNLISDKNYYNITLSDNGIGFESEYSEKIFEVFQRLHKKEDYVGTGIGLAIVKKIVDNHDGIITAKGELDKGATFNIYLPYF